MPSRPYDADHAWYYDAAFSWDVSEEAAWLRGLFDADEPAILEPACGSGRLLLPLAEAGFRTAGCDRSPDMLERCRRRFESAGVAAPVLREGDMVRLVDLEFGMDFHGGVLPLGTFGCLQTASDAAEHLSGMARHLYAGGRYLVQFELRDLAEFRLSEPGPTSRWDTETERGTLRCSVFGREWDPVRRIETQVQRFEFLDGPRAGEVAETEHPMHVWDWDTFEEVIGTSPFLVTGAWDGNAPGRPALEPGPGLEDRPLTWIELTLA